MECQLKSPPPHNKLCGLLTNKTTGEHMVVVVVGDTLRLAPANPLDPKQQWTKIFLDKDDEGNLAFVLAMNAAIVQQDMTVKAIKQPLGPNMPVRVVDYKYDPCTRDPTLLWTEKDGCNGFVVIREFKNNALVLDARNGEVVVANYNGGDSQLWKFKPNVDA